MSAIHHCGHSRSLRYSPMADVNRLTFTCRPRSRRYTQSAMGLRPLGWKMARWSIARSIFATVAAGGLAIATVALTLPASSPYFHMLIAAGVIGSTVGVAALILLLIFSTGSPGPSRRRDRNFAQKNGARRRRESAGPPLRKLCELTGHSRSKRYARPAGGTWRSECRFCGTPLVRLGPGHWMPIPPTEDDLDHWRRGDS